MIRRYTSHTQSDGAVGGGARRAESVAGGTPPQSERFERPRTTLAEGALFRGDESPPHILFLPSAGTSLAGVEPAESWRWASTRLATGRSGVVFGRHMLRATYGDLSSPSIRVFVTSATGVFF